MEITNDEITYVATLARLDIDKTSVEELASQMGKILGYVDTLKTLDTTGVPATTHASFLTNVFREDIVKESLDVDDALQNAPKSEDGYFIVPKVI
ncbi:MAG: aspartyl/glutamyl-tRNA(Asn/Gln) amidotransferase subunit C [Desulfobacteraceae bacterium 4572_19]|nr:MAG: aspartyl/glutamyl-tRNA(Asn/Gln) amidotransferase subunit C [Desulfobacteraceae bacterium 4572_19]